MTNVKSEYSLDPVTGQRYVITKLGGTTTSDGSAAGLVVSGPGGFVMPGGGALDVKRGQGLLDAGDQTSIQTDGTLAAAPATGKVHDVTFDTADGRDTASITISGEVSSLNDSVFYAYIQGAGGTHAAALLAFDMTHTVTEVTPGSSGENSIVAIDAAPILLMVGKTNIIPVDFSILMVSICMLTGPGAAAAANTRFFQIDSWKR